MACAQGSASAAAPSTVGEGHGADRRPLFEDVAGELVDSILEDVVMGMAAEIACEVGFEEDAPDVWELRRR